MPIYFVLLIIVFLIFAVVIAFGAPYLPTLNSRVDEAIKLLNLKPGQTFLELGCGDGRMLVAGAKEGLKSVGYEMNPFLFIYAYIRCYRYKKLIKIVWGNYWTKQWPQADGMYVFLLQSYMPKLDKKIVQYLYGRSFKLVSFGFKIKNRPYAKEQKGMFLYNY